MNKKIKNSSIIFLLLLTICFAFATQSTNICFAKESSPKEAYDFANHLFQIEDYYRAITEFKRIIFHYPDHDLSKKARLKIGYAYKSGQKWRDAILEFTELNRLYPDLEIGKEAYFQIAETYFFKRDFKKAASNFENFITKYPNIDLKDKAEYKIGLSYLNMGEYDFSKDIFKNIRKKSNLYEKASTISEEITDYKYLSKKSPALAGTLSTILPGAGQAYVGRYKDGFLSFLLNGLFIWGTVESINQDSQVVAAILAFFEMGWYSGNIYNSISSAHKYNKRTNHNFIDNLNKRYDISKNLSHNNLYAKVNFSFNF